MKKSILTTTAFCASIFVWNQHAAKAQEVAAPEAPAAIAVKEGKTVKRVDVKLSGPNSVDKGRVLSNMSLKEGEPYSQEKEEADIKSLFNSGIAENISITSEIAGDGVNVTVSLEPRSALGEVAFLGNSAFDSDRLSKEIDLKVGSSADDAKLQEARKVIEELYTGKGYTDVTVNYEVAAAGNGFSRVTFKIDEGQRGYLNDVRFEGNAGVDSKALKKLLKVDDRGFKFWTGPKLEQDKLDEDIKAIETYYQDRGYVNAKVVGADKVRVENDKVDLVFKISEGSVFTVTEVNLSGVSSFRPADLTPAGGFNLESGATFSGKSLKADLSEIKRFYASRGYADVRVSPQVKNSGADSIAVTYAVEEGSIFQVDKINFSGNDSTRDEVMRREMAINPGDTFNQTTIDISERRLRGLGYFEDITLIPSDSATPGYKDLNIAVKEGQTGQLNFGLGFSSIDNLVGFVDLRQKNFDIGSWPPVGAGQNFYMTIKAGTKRKDLGVGWYEPWLFSKPLGFGVELFYNEKTYLSDVYDQTNVGGDIYFRKKINEDSDLRLQLMAQQVSIDGIDEDASELIKAEEGDYNHNELTLTWNYDTRDDNITPRKGFKAAIDLSAAFGDVSDQGIAAQFSKPVQLPWDVIFTASGAAEYVSGDDVPIFERTFLGGARDLRGFDYRDVGPKDENGEPLGGDTAWFLSAELTFPIIERFRGAVFYDVGEVSGGPGTKGGGVNSNYGIGARVNLPIFGPLRLDYGIPMQADEFNDNGGRFQISVDYKF